MAQSKQQRMLQDLDDQVVEDESQSSGGHPRDQADDDHPPQFAEVADQRQTPFAGLVPDRELGIPPLRAAESAGSLFWRPEGLRLSH
jgi:hypothetical protein